MDFLTPFPGPERPGKLFHKSAVESTLEAGKLVAVDLCELAVTSHHRSKILRPGTTWSGGSLLDSVKSCSVVVLDDLSDVNYTQWLDCCCIVSLNVVLINFFLKSYLIYYSIIK